MQIHTLIPKTKNTKTMIVGRGGKRGKTSGRGGKGQTARAGNKRRPELRDFIKKFLGIPLAENENEDMMQQQMMQQQMMQQQQGEQGGNGGEQSTNM